MILKKIVLHNFRNFDNKEFVFSPFLTIIFGENTMGKTNLLEAIYCLTNGVGFRETREVELVKIEKTQAKIKGIFVDDQEKIEFQINLDTSEQFFEKKYFINKTNKRSSQYQQEVIKTILFSPQQLEIITGSPDSRRQYFDKLISFYDLEYKKRLTNYENALRKRNKILEVFQSDSKLREELFFWDDYLEEQADYISKKREKYANYLNQNQKIDNKKFSIKYLANQFTKKRLEEIYPKEKRYRRTLIGPQKDDFQIDVVDNDFKKNLHSFGSRSEHRLGVFWLKVNEIRYYEQIAKKKPVVLLDDIFSELDRKNKKLILNLISKYQTVLTTAEAEALEISDVPSVVINL